MREKTSQDTEGKGGKNKARWRVRVRVERVVRTLTTKRSKDKRERRHGDGKREGNHRGTETHTINENFSQQRYM